MHWETLYALERDCRFGGHKFLFASTYANSYANTHADTSARTKTNANTTAATTTNANTMTSTTANVYTNTILMQLPMVIQTQVNALLMTCTKQRENLKTAMTSF